MCFIQQELVDFRLLKLVQGAFCTFLKKLALNVEDEFGNMDKGALRQVRAALFEGVNCKNRESDEK